MLRHPYAIAHLVIETTPQKEGAERKSHHNAGQRWRTLVVVMTGTVPAVTVALVCTLLVAAFWAVVVVAVPTAAAVVVEGTRVRGVTAGGTKTLANIALLARDCSSAREASSPVPRALALPRPNCNGGNALPVHVRGRREAINTMHMYARFACVNGAARAMADAVLGRSVRWAGCSAGHNLKTNRTAGSLSWFIFFSRQDDNCV